MNKNNLGYVFFAILGIVIGLAISALFKGCSDIPSLFSSTKDTLYAVDTVDRIIPGDTVTIYGKAQIRYIKDTVAISDTVFVLRDTVYETPPFIATLDTITPDCDTAHIEYRFPLNTFFMELNRSADTVKTQYVTLTVREYKKPQWYEYAGAAAVGVIVGFFVKK